jgi:hypothetical protein
MIQAAERARHAIAQHATGWDVISGVTSASSASQAVSVIANSMMVVRNPPRWRAVRPYPSTIAARGARHRRDGARLSGLRR